MTARVLIVDDEGNLRRMLRAVLEESGYAVDEAEHGDAAVALVPKVAPDVVLLDLIMSPGPDGLTVLQRLRTDLPDLTVIMMSGKASLTDAVRATKLGAFQFLEKPLSPEAVLTTVRAALDLARARADNRALRAWATGRRCAKSRRSSRAWRPPRRGCWSPASPAPARSWWPGPFTPGAPGPPGPW